MGRKSGRLSSKSRGRQRPEGFYAAAFFGGASVASLIPAPVPVKLLLAVGIAIFALRLERLVRERTNVNRRKSLAVLSALAFVAVSAAFVSRAVDDGGSRCPEDNRVGLHVMTPLRVQPQTAPAGSRFRATFAVCQLGPLAGRIAGIRAAVRPLNGRPCSGPNSDGRWEQPALDFPLHVVAGAEIKPGTWIDYEASAAFMEPGEYFAEPVKVDDTGTWGGIS